MTKLFRYLLMLASSLFGASPAVAQDAPVESAVKQMFESYVLAFNAGDFESLANLWCEDATYVDHSTGERTEGREAIVADIKAALEANPSLRLSGTISHLSKLDDDLFSVQGEVMLTKDESSPASYRFTSIAKRSGNRWQMRMVEEFAVVGGSGAGASLAQLDWLIGVWEAGEGDAKVVSTIRPAIGGAFLVRSYQSTGDDGVLQQSTEIIGVDPRSQVMVMWSFHSDGSFGTGVVTKEDDQWKIASTQTLSDGRSASGMFVVTRVDNDTLTVQLQAHEIDGEPQPTEEPTTMKRVGGN